jgi:Ca2+-binding RTX toxin-like protein
MASVIIGTSGSDVIDKSTSTKDLIVEAGKGNDTIKTGSGNDLIIGGSGNDNISSGAGNDIISAGDGTNYINAGSGNDLAVGGKGADTFYHKLNENLTATDIYLAGAGNDKLIIDLQGMSNAAAYQAAFQYAMDQYNTFISSPHHADCIYDLGIAVKNYFQSHHINQAVNFSLNIQSIEQLQIVNDCKWHCRCSNNKYW